MQDLTKLVFQSTGWLVVSLFLYYFISAAKVFLLVGVQPALFHSQTNLKLTVRSLWPLFVNKFFTSKKIHQSTLSFLINRGGKQSWILLDNKKVNLYYNFLDTITTTLKPFILVGILWAILNVMVEYRIFYDELKITLGEIQEQLVYINSITWVHFIEDNLTLLFIGIFLILVVLGIVKAFESRIKKAKIIISYCFTILGIFTSLSFFGSNLGVSATRHERKLKELDLEVRDIHEGIYKDLAEAIVHQDLAAATYEELKSFEIESNRLDSLNSLAQSEPVDPEFSGDLVEKISSEKADFDNNINPDEKPKSEVVVTSFAKATVRPLSNALASYYSTESANIKTGDYVSKPSTWNKENGLKFKNLVTEVKQAVYFNSKVTESMRTVSKTIVELMIEGFFDKITSLTGLGDYKLPRAIAEFISIENCKECFVKKLANVLTAIQTKVQNVKNKMRETACFINEGNNANWIGFTRKKHDATFNEAIEIARAGQVRKDAKIKIENEIETKIRTAVEPFKNNITGDLEEYIIEVKNDYMRQIDFEQLSKRGYEKIKMSPLPKRQLSLTLFRTMERHPFPSPPACPICALAFGSRIIPL